MKNVFVFVAILTAFAASESYAQSQSATVNLSVNSAIGIVKNRDLNFGTVSQGITTASISPITGGASAAMFTVTAAASTLLNVTFSTTDLTDGGGHTITFAGAGTLSGLNANTQASSASVSSGGTVTTNASGNYYFWAGGTATLSPTQAANAYSGTFTLTLSY
jgi:hypothetical protein